MRSGKRGQNEELTAMQNVMSEMLEGICKGKYSERILPKGLTVSEKCSECSYGGLTNLVVNFCVRPRDQYWTLQPGTGVRVLLGRSCTLRRYLYRLPTWVSCRD